MEAPVQHAVEVILALIGVAGLCYWAGFEHGVKETEERWSEAVAKANYERDMSRSR